MTGGKALGPLPVVPRPETDERLSSWLNRIARLYAMPIEALLDHCGLSRSTIIGLEWRLGGGEGALLARCTGMTVEALRTLTFEEIVAPAHLMVALRSRYVCAQCPADVHRKAAALPWSFRCAEHDSRFGAVGGRRLDLRLPEAVLTALDIQANAGAMLMTAWAKGQDEHEPALPELLAFLTSRHRKASPPSLAEQPRLSLEARWANHGFLTQPITRQALQVVVPEYDRAAPVLTKPVRPGLFGLAQGSLLQNYALAVGVARLSADPVGCAASVLLASDQEGEEKIRKVLRAWPLATRRRIYLRLDRLRAVQIEASAPSCRVKQANGRQPVSKFRFTQSHKSALGIS
jgi:hypothetical protein